MTDFAALHRGAGQEATRRVAQILEDQWGLPTSCEDWDVRALLNHMVYGNRWVVPIMQGKTIEEVGDWFDGDLLGDDPRSAWQNSLDEADSAFGEDGAMERIVHLSFGDVPASVYAGQRFVDHLVHAWDLARAIGAKENLDDELVHAAIADFRTYESEAKASGQYGERLEIPPDTTPQEELLLLFGRTP